MIRVEHVPCMPKYEALFAERSRSLMYEACSELQQALKWRVMWREELFAREIFLRGTYVSRQRFGKLFVAFVLFVLPSKLCVNNKLIPQYFLLSPSCPREYVLRFVWWRWVRCSLQRRSLAVVPSTPLSPTKKLSQILCCQLNQTKHHVRRIFDK